MHELGLAKDLFHVIKERGRANNLKRITSIRIKLGLASGIDESLLIHSFADHLFPNTIAEGARLEIIKESPVVRCKGCGAKIDNKDELILSCPQCKEMDMEVVAGRDIHIEEIEGE
jgi:hydrogenase nickel insertion protein HypA